MESLALTRTLNTLFAGPVDSLLNLVGIHPANPAAPIDNTFALELLIVAGLIVYFIVVRATLSVEKPSALQHVAEMIHEFIQGQGDSIIGHSHSRFQAFTTCIFMFVLICNLSGLIPGIPAPTMTATVPLGLAICTFIYYNFHGIRVHGPIGYLKEFAGPIWWISWLLFPIELISHCARIMSLTIRLWANMFAGDLVTLVFFSLIPAVIPVAFMALHLMVSVIQALVFTLLTMIYLSGAVAGEHEH
jgi:F-type H+-transporting ATPase subunit a